MVETMVDKLAEMMVVQMAGPMALQTAEKKAVHWAHLRVGQMEYRSVDWSVERTADTTAAQMGH